jgi:two-component system, cell cycle sensor histidine kinase PleC
MTPEIVRQSFLYFRPIRSARFLAPPQSWSGDNIVKGIKQAFAPAVAIQVQTVLIVTGLVGLLFGAPAAVVHGSIGTQAGSVCVLLAAAATILAFASHRRHSAKIHALSLSLEGRAKAIQGAGGIILHWELLNGNLIWAGNAAEVLGVSQSQVPKHFRELRPFLHPDDALYHRVSDALRLSISRVAWLVRLKDSDKGWNAFQLRGSITSGEKGQGPVFCGLLLPDEGVGASQSGPENAPSRLAEIVEALPIPFAIWDRHARLSLCNRKFRQLYKIPGVAALPGTSFEELQAQAREPVLQRPSLAQTAAGRFEIRDKQLGDGSWLQIGEYWTGDGMMVSVGTDITMAKLNERRVLEREQNMRARVAGFEQSRRQLEIQTEQLRELAESYNEEKIRAEAANQAKSEFLANVSHELRTPLNAIIGFSEMIRDEVLGPIGNAKYESYVKDINASGRYLLEMINDILDMSKIEAGRMTFSPEWVTLGDLFPECLAVVHPSALERNVELIQGGNPHVSFFGDKRALKQVLINLLANAVKFTLPGGKVILRSYRYRGSVRIAITDTGVGIAKHDLGRLGKPFEQVENQLTKGHKGTGLGLAISRSLVEMHGGKLDIKSRVGEGTTVTCVLPVNEEKELEREAA